MKKIKWRTYILVCMMISSLAAGLIFQNLVILASHPDGEKLTQVVKIGAILPLSGELSSQGEQIQVALSLSEADLNAYLAETEQSYRMEIIFRDSQGIPDEALEQTRALHHEGVSLFITGSSAETEAIKPWSDQNEVVVISYNSSAPSLAVPNDSIFRVVPDDHHQASALAALLESQDTQVVVPVFRNDVYGQEMYQLFKDEFLALTETGSVTEAISYEPQTKDFKKVAEQIDRELEASDTSRDQTAILLIAFEEASLLFEASDHLQDLRWYGTETLTLNAFLNDRPKALEFAEKVAFTGVTYGLLETNYYYQVKQAIEAETERYAVPNALYAYDIPWLLAAIVSELGVAVEIQHIKERFVQLSESFIGATGWVVLNESGDRKYASYDIWQVQSDGGESFWARLGTYLRTPGFPGYISWVEGYAPKMEPETAFLLGFNQSSYAPLSTVYRDEFAYMLAGALQIESSENADHVEFTFVDKDWIDERAIDSVKFAVQKGILVGYKDHSLRPHHTITRIEMIAMVSRAIHDLMPDEVIQNGNGGNGFSDADQIPAWAADSVHHVTSHGLLNLAEGEPLDPFGHITLAEATEICLKVMSMLQK